MAGQPVTREELHQELGVVKDELRRDLSAVKDELRQELSAVQNRLSEQMRDMQTELLKAFLPWQEQVRVQFRELEANTGNSVTAMKQRMDIVERRLSEIEKKLLMEPPAA